LPDKLNGPPGDAYVNLWEPPDRRWLTADGCSSMGGCAFLPNTLDPRQPVGVPGLRKCDPDRAEGEVGWRQKVLDSWQALEVPFYTGFPTTFPLESQRLAASYTVCIYRISPEPSMAVSRL
jgi:hypothetical protein